MTRVRQTALALLVVACAVLLVTPDVAAQPTITQIWPPGNGAGGPNVIAVLSDHYGSSVSDTAAFNSDANRLFVTGLMADPNYVGFSPLFTIKTIHNPFPSAAPLSTNSNYGFEAVTSGNCEVSSLGAATATAVENVASAVAPRLIVVIGNYTFDSGCTDYNWTFVYARAAPRVVAHELGHLIANLYDEYVTKTGPDPTTVTDKHCSTQVP